MMLPKQFTSIVVFSLLASCAGSVETIDGGDGDGDGGGDGDGDQAVPGDGDSVLPGDGDSVLPGDGDYVLPGDGDSVVPGDGDYVVPGDGDMTVPPPGVGGSGPIYPPPIGGTGGVIIRPPATGGAPGVPIGTPIDPATCSEDWRYTDGTSYCEQQMQCSDTYAYVWCDVYSGTGNCTCDRSGASFSVSIDDTFFAGGAGCERMMDACLGGGELEVVGQQSCATTYLEQYVDYCGTNYVCQTPVSVGGAIGNIQEYSEAWCENYSGQWACNCYADNTSSLITYLEPQVSPDVCIDAIATCGAAVFDPSLPAACTPRSQWAERDYCNFETECSQERAINGQRVEVSQWRSGGCTLVGIDQWECSCGNAGASIGIMAASGWDACSIASVSCSP